jgi:hypothetical protein
MVTNLVWLVLVSWWPKKIPPNYFAISRVGQGWFSFETLFSWSSSGHRHFNQKFVLFFLYIWTQLLSSECSILHIATTNYTLYSLMHTLSWFGKKALWWFMKIQNRKTNEDINTDKKNATYVFCLLDLEVPHKSPVLLILSCPSYFSLFFSCAYFLFPFLFHNCANFIHLTLFF